MDFAAIPVGTLAQAVAPGTFATFGSLAVRSIPYLEKLLVASTAMAYSRKRPRTSGGYGRMNYKAGMFYGKTSIGRSLSIKGMHSFKRTVQFTVPYIPTTGFQIGTASQSLSLGFSLSQLLVNTAAATTIAIPGFADLVALFDKWRIAGVRVKIFFQQNSSSVASATTNMPLLNYVVDSSDAAPVVLADILQYPDVRQYQFGNGATNAGCLMVGVKPRAHLSTGDQIVGQALAAGGRVEPASAWMDTSAPLVQYNSLKMVLDGFGATQATTEGSFSFYVDITYQCKDAL